MKYASHYIIILTGLLILFTGCNPKLEWKFSKEITLKDISPIGIVYQDDGFWLSDAEHNRILKVSLDGEVQQEYKGFNRPMHISGNNSKIYVPEFLTDTIKIISGGKVKPMNSIGETDAPAAISVKEGMVAIADFYNHRIILQQSDTITLIGTEGHNESKLYYPTDVEIYGDLVYVADAYNNRVQVFDGHGNFIRSIGESDNINVASGIYVTSTHLYVTDFYGNRLLIYDKKGKLIQVLKGYLSNPVDVVVSKRAIYVANYGGNSIVVYKR